MSRRILVIVGASLLSFCLGVVPSRSLLNRRAALLGGGALSVAAATTPLQAVADDGSWAEHKGAFEPSFFDDFTPSKASPNFKYKFISQGEGEKPVNKQQVFVHYSGYLLDGTKFDSSYGFGKDPFKFRVGKGKVISGWEGLVLGMSPGSKLIALIPPEYAYGDKGIGPIPPGASLVFYMEMVKLGNIKGDKPRLPDLNDPGF